MTEERLDRLEHAVIDLNKRINSIETTAAARAFDTYINSNYKGDQRAPDGTYCCDDQAYRKLLAIQRQLSAECCDLDTRLGLAELLTNILTEDFDHES